MVFFSLLAAIIPAVFYVGIVWWLDKYEKEPWPLFLAAFAYGSIPAIILAIVFELGAEAVGVGGLAGGVVVAPIVEEAVKGLAVLLIFFIWRREFDGVLDGVVYGAVVGYGFAMTENFFYFIDTGGDPMVVLLRAFVFGANHAFFTAFTGAALGLARLSRKRWLWLLLFPAGLLVAMGFHAAHNLSVNFGCAGLSLALVSNTVGVAVILVIAILSWRQEKRWIGEELTEEVAAGTLAEDDLQALLYLRRRVGARLWIWRRHGWRAFRLLGKYLNLATEMAFGKHYLRAGIAHRKRAYDLEQTRNRLAEIRGRLLGILEDV